MIKIHIISVGKTKEQWLDQAIAEYVKRLSAWAAIDFTWCKDDFHLLTQMEKESGSVICLDPSAAASTSEGFAQFLDKKIVAGGARVTFVIGGPEGLPPLLKRYPLISLSPMTFTHQIARLILIEQIYRAYTLLKGIPYHK